MRNPYNEMGVESILLVDDDPWSINSLTTFFQIVGCRMHSAVNAKEAFTAMSQDRFDLILCEYQIQDMNGLALLKKLGDIHPGPVKFLFTSYPVEKLAGEAARSGIDEVIRKPFTMERLEESLKRCFPRGRQGGREPVGAG
jgi:two-component system response regulator HydG